MNVLDVDCASSSLVSDYAPPPRRSLECRLAAVLRSPLLQSPDRHVSRRRLGASARFVRDCDQRTSSYPSPASGRRGATHHKINKWNWPMSISDISAKPLPKMSERYGIRFEVIKHLEWSDVSCCCHEDRSSNEALNGSCSHNFQIINRSQ